MMTLMKKSAFARSRGCSRAAVTAWEKGGFLVLSDDGSGRVDVEASNKLLDARPYVHKGRPSLARTVEAAKKPDGRHPAAPASKAPAPLPGSPDDWSTHEAVRRREIANAGLKQLELKQRAGRLLPADEIESSWRGAIADARKRLLTVSSRCSARLTQLSRSEVDVIDREVRDALQELSGEHQS